MNINQLKEKLADLEIVSFILPNGNRLPPHFHVTEVGLVTKHFIDCGGVERKEVMANFQLWEADDYDHRLSPQKFLKILEISEKVLEGIEDLEIEVEYQQATIGKFGLDFFGEEFVLTVKRTACLAMDKCGVTPLQMASSPCCSPDSGCC